MESHPYTKTRGVGPVTTKLTPGAEPASSKFAGAPGPWSCSPTCRAWSQSSRPSFTDSISTGAGCTCSPCNTGAGCTCSPCNKCWATPSAFLHQQLDVTTSRTSTSSFRYELICNSCYLLLVTKVLAQGGSDCGPRWRRELAGTVRPKIVHPQDLRQNYRLYRIYATAFPGYSILPVADEDIGVAGRRG